MPLAASPHRWSSVIWCIRPMTAAPSGITDSCAAKVACRSRVHRVWPNAVKPRRSRRDSTMVLASPDSLIMASTCRAASAGSPSWDHNCSDAGLSDSVIALTTRSWASRLSWRNAAMAKGTLIVDQATPDDHRPSEKVRSGRQIEMPMLAGTVAESCSKLDSIASPSGREVMCLAADRPDRIAAIDALGRQLTLEHLEGHRPRQLRADPDVRRPLLGTQVRLLGQKGPEFLGIEVRAGSHHQRGHHLVADHGIGHRVHRYLGRIVVAQQHPFDRGRAEVFAVHPHPI